MGRHYAMALGARSYAARVRLRVAPRRNGPARVSGQAAFRPPRHPGPRRASPPPRVDDAVAAADEIGYPCVVKAQVLIGGRGKAGGIKLAQTRATRRASTPPPSSAWTSRASPSTRCGSRQASDIAAEYYASIVFDRSAKAPLVMLSTQGRHGHRGGRRATTRTRSRRLHVDPLLGFQDFHGRRLAFEAGVDADLVRPVGALLAKLYDTFVAEEAMLVEVNPLIVTAEREVAALDAKVTLDGNALFRHPDNAELRDPSDEDPQEQMAKERGLTYVKLDGDIGILGNGAGLVMSTLDVVAQAGGAPANFLDAGGGSKAEAIVSAVEVILSNHEGQGRAVQHLRRHHALRRGRQRPDRGVRRRSSRRCRSSCAWTARTTSRAAAPRRRRAAQRRTPRRRWTRPPQKVVALAEGRRRPHERPGRQRHQASSSPASPAARARSTRSTTAATARRRRRRHARQGRPGRRGHPGLQHVPRRRRRDRREHGDDLRAAALRRRLDPRGRRRRHRARHRASPRASRRTTSCASTRTCSAARTPPGRPQLPRHPVAGQGERRHHPGLVLQGGQRRRRLALGHADLPDRQRAGPARLRQLVDRRHRRRPGRRARRSSTSSSCSRRTTRPS